MERRSILHAESPHLPSSPLVRIMRLWLPIALCVVGVILMVVDDFDGFGVSAFAAFAGAGSSIWLINFLWRLGVSGDDDRDREAEDRAYLAKYGSWPDEGRRDGSRQDSQRPVGSDTR